MTQKTPESHFMANPQTVASFERLKTSVSQFDVSGRTLLIPNMAPTGVRLLAACFRAVGVNAVVMETYKGLNLGKEFTSGKECFPCQVTLGDILHHLKKEEERLGEDFSPRNYVYFLPEADGPCRFGMYNKMQRLVLDRFPAYKDLPIVYLSTGNSYATADILSPQYAPIFRRLSYVALIIADVFDRTVWRVRPYEKRPGMTDEFMDGAIEEMAALIERIGTTLDFAQLYRCLETTVATAAGFIDPQKPRRPRIGIVGEIYLRTHPDSNQEIIRQIEKFGGEVVDASLGEWVNYVTYEQLQKAARKWRLAWRERDHGVLRKLTLQWISLQIERWYQAWRQGQVYRIALRHLDIQQDHDIAAVEKRLDRDRLYSFAIGTEAALSIGGALEYVHEGFDGVVNVFPFTCMPSTICASILKPLLLDKRIPYLDAPYDGTYQPNREIVLRTFLYQARQHLESRRAKRENGKN